MAINRQKRIAFGRLAAKALPCCAALALLIGVSLCAQEAGSAGGAAKTESKKATPAAQKAADDSDTGLKWTWKDLLDGDAVIAIENATAKDQKITATLGEFGFVDGNGNAISNSTAGLSPVVPATLRKN